MVRTEEDVRYINRLVNLENKSVLEIGCGTGRITFPLAMKAREIVAIDVNERVIEEASRRNRYENVRFSVGNIESVRLGSKFDVILSTWMGYMYLNDMPKAIQNISNHLEDDGVFLLLCGYYDDEYTKIVRMLIGGKAKRTSFYNEVETILSAFFTFERHILKGELVFSSVREVTERLRLELKNEYGLTMDNHHEQQLRGYLRSKDKLAIGNDSLAYRCRKHASR
ncbi:MAG: class I SAM-dependent methyltransferase [Candidatus Bathyarchaeota archaeon]|nr:MAG: class I SAM-dependent methyltransferase [Candidatus Bathyarchaeota archaeon]